MAAYITTISGQEISWHVNNGHKLDRNRAMHIMQIQADGHELDLINRHYPMLVSRARVQTFFGDIAKLVYCNALCCEAEI